MIVTAALIPNEGRLFVAQRPPWKKFGLLWEFPGGKVESGESLEESLVREIREELCLEISIQAPFRSVSYKGPVISLDLHSFWCSVEGGVLCLREHIAFEWFSIHELKTVNLTEADRLLIPSLESLGKFPELSRRADL